MPINLQQEQIAHWYCRFIGSSLSSSSSPSSSSYAIQLFTLCLARSNHQLFPTSIQLKLTLNTFPFK
ncbi:hypothetical protein BLOT_001366 [Blomia tropicalis]|nr:hypothetical protein BLOT_001366 [Blomia tropicalis]